MTMAAAGRPWAGAAPQGPVLLGWAPDALIALPFTAAGRALGFTALPAAYWPYLAATVVGYVVLTQTVKAFLLRRGWI